ncbi:Aste57867_12182 [Aphanomyces stellatus]|uniref:Aste57867_12182 protein n=1 Tax=Aphanomyces stellatus TaxID=120398 RepID=A0A485KUV2_9STRA|nr:hypothetical protein As57867_012137 [Aphanomyces stellatus]VFT89036.1 Aste57867_12182 [Aphanomyces stellatus]
MNPSELEYTDAIFFSGHKFLGGPGSPGVLVIKSKWLRRNIVPVVPSGGTVVYVTNFDQDYSPHIEEREEGGTPETIGAIRLGLAFQVKHRIGSEAILALEHANVIRVHQRFHAHPNIVVLGGHGNPTPASKLPIFSFLIRHRGRFLHFNYVGALLNDLFGVQSRGGCMCAAPYSHRLMGVSDAINTEYAKATRDMVYVVRPGYSRISFPYIMSDAQVEYIVSAVEFVASHGWKFLPQYEFKQATGAWTHKNLSLLSTTYMQDLGIDMACHGLGIRPSLKIVDTKNYHMYLTQAMALADEASHMTSPIGRNPIPTSVEYLRWFSYPWESDQGKTDLALTSRCPLAPIVYGDRRATPEKEMLQVWSKSKLVWMRILNGGKEVMPFVKPIMRSRVEVVC